MKNIFLSFVALSSCAIILTTTGCTTNIPVYDPIESMSSETESNFSTNVLHGTADPEQTWSTYETVTVSVKAPYSGTFRVFPKVPLLSSDTIPYLMVKSIDAAGTYDVSLQWPTVLDTLYMILTGEAAEKLIYGGNTTANENRVIAVTKGNGKTIADFSTSTTGKARHKRIGLEWPVDSIVAPVFMKPTTSDFYPDTTATVVLTNNVSASYNSSSVNFEYTYPYYEVYNASTNYGNFSSYYPTKEIVTYKDTVIDGKTYTITAAVYNKHFQIFRIQYYKNENGKITGKTKISISKWKINDDQPIKIIFEPYYELSNGERTNVAGNEYEITAFSFTNYNAFPKSYVENPSTVWIHYIFNNTVGKAQTYYIQNGASLGCYQPYFAKKNLLDLYFEKGSNWVFSTNPAEEIYDANIYSATDIVLAEKKVSINNTYRDTLQFINDGTLTTTDHITGKGIHFQDGVSVQNNGSMILTNSKLTDVGNPYIYVEGGYFENNGYIKMDSVGVITAKKLVNNCKIESSYIRANSNSSVYNYGSIKTHQYMQLNDKGSGTLVMGPNAVLDCDSLILYGLDNESDEKFLGVAGPADGTEYGVIHCQSLTPWKKGEGFSSPTLSGLLLLDCLNFRSPDRFTIGSDVRFSSCEYPYYVDSTECNSGYTPYTDCDLLEARGSSIPSIHYCFREGLKFYWAFEDLGTSADFDFNDVVIYAKLYDDSCVYYLAAAGATLPIEIKIDGKNFGEVHELFGVDTVTMVNTGAGPTLEPVFLTSLPYLKTNVVSIIVNGSNGAYEIGDEGVSTVSGNTPLYIKLNGVFSKAGDWWWPSEKTPINVSYSGFGEWGKNYKSSLDWYWKENVTGPVYKY